MSYRGDIRLGDTIDIKFATVSTSTVPTTLAGSPVISAYVGNGTTEITAGITLTVDFDSRTGMHNVRVVASSGNGFATATNVDLVITAGTVSGTSVVGMIVGSFSIENRSALMPTTAGRTVVIDAAGLADSNMVKAGPTGSGTAITARDIGASVLLSSGTGTGQLSITSGIAKVDVDTIKTNPVVNAGTVTFPTTATLASTTGAVGSVTGAVGSVTARVTANTDQLAGQTVTAAAGVTFPTSVASPTNITSASGISVGTGGIAAAAFAANAIDSAALATSAATEIASAVFSRAFSATYSSLTFEQLVEIIAAGIAGKADGLAGTTVHYRSLDDTQNVITATVDSSGNRTAITLNP